MDLKEKLILVLYKTSSANHASELLEIIANEFAVDFTTYVFDNYVKFGDYFHLKGEVYWNTTRKTIDELLLEYKKTQEIITNIKKLDAAFDTLFSDKKIKKQK